MTTVQRVAQIFGWAFVLVAVLGFFTSAGIMAARSWSGAKSYCQISGIAYIGLAILGFFIPTTFGLIPIGGNDIWLHFLLGIPLAYFGFTAHDRAPARATA